MKEYILKPIMTPATLNRTSTADKSVVARPVPPRQPLPTATIDPTKPLLKLGLDVHLEFIMVVGQPPVTPPSKRLGRPLDSPPPRAPALHSITLRASITSLKKTPHVNLTSS